MDTARYHRQMLLPAWGEEGQRALGSAHALVVGVGALGCVLADQLTRAGIGTLTLVDRDIVERTNLQRQILFDESDAADAVPKAEAARRRLAAINAAVNVTAVVADFTHESARRIAIADDGPPDLILDGTDNFETRYLLNDLALARGIPYLYAGAVGTRGLILPVLAGTDAHPQQRSSPPGPCLRCLFPDLPPAGTQPTCDTAGVLGPLISIVAGWQAALALHLLTGNRRLVRPALTEFDLHAGTTRAVDVSTARDLNCPCCVGRDFAFLEGRRGHAPAALCGKNAVQVAGSRSAGDPPLDLASLAALLEPHGCFTPTPFLLRGTLDAERLNLTLFRDGRAIIEGTDDPARARAVYAKYIGS